MIIALVYVPHTIDVWYIYLYLVHVYGKCRCIYIYISYLFTNKYNKHTSIYRKWLLIGVSITNQAQVVWVYKTSNFRPCKNCDAKAQLVGGFNPFEKYCSSQIGHLPQIGVTIKIFETTTQPNLVRRNPETPKPFERNTGSPLVSLKPGSWWESLLGKNSNNKMVVLPSTSQS